MPGILNLTPDSLHHLLSRLMYKATRCTWHPWKNALIRLFIRKYKVDMSLAERSTASEYETFNDFFTRSLKPATRPISGSANSLISPVDAATGAAGTLENDQMVQAKGKYYSLAELVHGDEDHIGYYQNGNFMTLYLSPRDYHRVHIPADGELVFMSYIPGRLFSVGPAYTHRVDRLFARNERVITTFRSEFGMFSVIFIGAIFVGSVATAWHGQVTPAARREYTCWHYEPGIAFARGDEIGRFNMGSTVILLTEPDRISWTVPGEQVTMGRQIATWDKVSSPSPDSGK